MEHPECAQNWYQQSNYLAWLSVANEPELYRLIEEAIVNNIPCSIFREPDIGNQITAIALAPGIAAKKLCSRLRLALKGI